MLSILFPCLSCSSMPADMTMLADHTARQLLDFSQKLDINLLDNVVNSMYYDVGSQVWVCLQVLKRIQIVVWCLPDTYSASKVVFVMIFLAKTCTRSSHQPEGPPRCLDQSGHHTGVLAEHEDKSMSMLMCFQANILFFECCYWM